MASMVAETSLDYSVYMIVENQRFQYDVRTCEQYKDDRKQCQQVVK